MMTTFATQLVLNLGLATMLVLLIDSLTVASFLVGFILGAVCIFAFFNTGGRKNFYLCRVWKLLVLVVVFFRELLIACVIVLKSVFQPISHLNPGIIAMEVNFQTNFELVLLCNMITLTPGTLTLDISPDNKIIYIHVLDCSDPAEVVAHIQKEFVDRMKEVWHYA